MKIAILGFTKIKFMPYMHFYLDQIDTVGDEVHLIYWKRDELPDAELPKGVTGHPFNKNMSDAMPLSKKLPSILGYGRFAKKTLKKIKPDLLIVMHSTTAISIYNVLVRKYRGKYIFDYRDVTYERNKFYRKAVAKIVKRSAISFTSSDGFRKYLPATQKLLTSHNLLASLLEHKSENVQEKHTPIRVAFWGLFRNQGVNKAIIDKLGGDKRFELHYYGRAQGAMLETVTRAAKDYENVFFHGEYDASDRPKMAKNTDLLHNIYSNSDKTASIAMGNKYYDGVMFKIPQLCMKGSLMGDLCEKYGVGLTCDPEDFDFADKLYEYYNSFDRKELTVCCNTELERILAEVENGNRSIKSVLDSMRND